MQCEKVYFEELNHAQVTEVEIKEIPRGWQLKKLKTTIK